LAETLAKPSHSQLHLKH